MARVPGVKVSDKRKANHNIFHCMECLKNHPDGLRLFPIRKMNLNGQKKAKKIGLKQEDEEVVKQIAKDTIKELDREFMVKYNWKFGKVAGIQSEGELKKSERKAYMAAKKDIEKSWKKTSVMRLEKGFIRRTK